MSELEQQEGLVAYTDGSAILERRAWGAGIHGYRYQIDSEKPSKAGAWLLTTHGYILQKDWEALKIRPGQVRALEYFDIVVSSKEDGTNNIGEMQALITILHHALLATNIRRLHVLADSELVKNGVNQWMDKWAQNHWKTANGAPVKNVERWKEIRTLVHQLRDKGVKFEITWVRAHNDNYGNVRADYLAAIGTNRSLMKDEQIDHRVTDPLRYHKTLHEIHPLLSYKRLYYNTDTEFNTKGRYYMTSWSGNDYIHGRRMGDVTFCVLQLKEPEPIIESIIDHQCSMKDVEYNTLVFLKMDRVKNADVLQYLERYGTICLRPDDRNHNLNFMDRKPVSIESRPGELPMRAVETLNHLDDLLNRYYTFKETRVYPEDGANYQLREITDHFYDVEQKKVGKTVVDKKVLKKAFGVGVKNTDITMEEKSDDTTKVVKYVLSFTDDLPGRNAMKRMEALNPSVFLLTWRAAANVISYAVVIDADDAVGIWSNYFANHIYL